MPIVGLIAAIASALQNSANNGGNGSQGLTQIGSALAQFLTKSKMSKSGNVSNAISNAKSVGNGRF